MLSWRLCSPVEVKQATYRRPDVDRSFFNVGDHQEFPNTVYHRVPWKSSHQIKGRIKLSTHRNRSGTREMSCRVFLKAFGKSELKTLATSSNPWKRANDHIKIEVEASHDIVYQWFRKLKTKSCSWGFSHSPQDCFLLHNESRIETCCRELFGQVWFPDEMRGEKKMLFLFTQRSNVLVKYH